MNLVGLLDKSKKNDLLPNIEKLRNEMINVGMENGLSSEETIFVSQKLDSVLNRYHILEEESIIDPDKINSILNKEELILITNKNGIIIYINDKCSFSLGYEPNELVGKHTKLLNAGVHSKEFYHDLWKTLLSGEPWKGEITSRRKDGSISWFFMLILPVLDNKNQPYQFLTLRIDITEQKDKERKALLKEKQLSSFMEILTNSVVGGIDQNGKILYVSPAVEEILGYKVSERLGVCLFDYIHPDTLPHFKNLIEELIKVPESSKTMEISIRRKNGSFLICEFTAKNFLHDPILKAIAFTYHDITERKKFHQEIKKMMYHDRLTGLPNLQSFDDQLNLVLDRSKISSTNFAVILLGLDDFKYVNATFGHHLGNQLLKDFSNSIRGFLGEKISLYRISGDCFSFLLEGIHDDEKVYENLNRFLSLLNKEPFKINGNDIYVSVSMGVSIFPYSGENKEELLKNTEVAMYSAKKRGKNQFQVFSSAMSIDSYKQFILRNDSKHALQRDEFKIYYQPRIHSMTNEIVSAEALIRWNHPQWGMVLPDEFISMAEDSGLIVPIGEWVIRKVCQDLKRWEEENLCFKKVSINISSLQLLQPNFVEMVSTILNELSVNPNWIEFEITESMIIEKEEEVLNTIILLKNLGITIALDDFGTGYSSLNYLKNFPCDVIKIDKSLIKDIHKDIESHEIIASIVSLCRRLRKRVVAEGVETEEQAMILRKLRCNESQGYLYSKPVDEQGYTELLKKGIGFKENKPAIYSGVNNRKYFRIPLQIPLVADMTIGKIGNKRIAIGSTEVLIQNIGPGGLSFCTELKMPVSKEIIILFTTVIFSKELKLKGNIIWYEEMESNYYQYGLEFTFNDIEREILIKILNTLQVKLKHKFVLPDCRFYTS
jgi:diguanylate cyclase (GGDEF)-like protein/PAS domain S-box-containing protein